MRTTTGRDSRRLAFGLSGGSRWLPLLAARIVTAWCAA